MLAAFLMKCCWICDVDAPTAAAAPRFLFPPRIKQVHLCANDAQILKSPQQRLKTYLQRLVSKQSKSGTHIKKEFG